MSQHMTFLRQYIPGLTKYDYCPDFTPIDYYGKIETADHKGITSVRSLKGDFLRDTFSECDDIIVVFGCRGGAEVWYLGCSLV